MRNLQHRVLSRYWPAAFVVAVFAFLAVLVWRHSFEAPDAVATESVSASTRSARTPISSPFAPRTDQDLNASALLGGVRLVGVRMSPEAARSGAIFLIAESDGEQAFIVGQDILRGVRLSAVAADHVLVDVGGGRIHTLTLAGETRALSGVATPASQPAVASRGQEPPSARAWLADTLARPEESLGPSPGWRVRPPMSDAASAAGLRVGDLILTINGASPSAASAAGTALQNDVIQLAVMRPDGERVTVWYSLD